MSNNHNSNSRNSSHSRHEKAPRDHEARAREYKAKLKTVVALLASEREENERSFAELQTEYDKLEATLERERRLHAKELALAQDELADLKQKLSSSRSSSKRSSSGKARGTKASNNEVDMEAFKELEEERDRLLRELVSRSLCCCFLPDKTIPFFALSEKTDCEIFNRFCIEWSDGYGSLGSSHGCATGEHGGGAERRAQGAAPPLAVDQHGCSRCSQARAHFIGRANAASRFRRAPLRRSDHRNRLGERKTTSGATPCTLTARAARRQSQKCAIRDAAAAVRS